MGLNNLFPPHVMAGLQLAGLAATAAGGAWAWHHTPIIGPAAVIKRQGEDIAAKAATIKAQAADIELKKTAIAERDAALKTNGGIAATEATQAGQFWRGQCRAAFEAGYASNSCRAAGGPSDPHPGADGVQRDLRTIWEAGAYRPAAPASAPGVPRKP